MKKLYFILIFIFYAIPNNCSCQFITNKVSHFKLSNSSKQGQGSQLQDILIDNNNNIITINRILDITNINLDTTSPIYSKFNNNHHLVITKYDSNFKYLNHIEFDAIDPAYSDFGTLKLNKFNNELYLIIHPNSFLEAHSSKNDTITGIINSNGSSIVIQLSADLSIKNIVSFPGITYHDIDFIRDKIFLVGTIRSQINFGTKSNPYIIDAALLAEKPIVAKYNNKFEFLSLAQFKKGKGTSSIINIRITDDNNIFLYFNAFYGDINPQDKDQYISNNKNPITIDIQTPTICRLDSNFNLIRFITLNLNSELLLSGNHGTSFKGFKVHPKDNKLIYLAYTVDKDSIKIFGNYYSQYDSSKIPDTYIFNKRTKGNLTAVGIILLNFDNANSNILTYKYEIDNPQIDILLHDFEISTDKRVYLCGSASAEIGKDYNSYYTQNFHTIKDSTLFVSYFNSNRFENDYWWWHQNNEYKYGYRNFLILLDSNFYPTFVQGIYSPNKTASYQVNYSLINSIAISYDNMVLFGGQICGYASFNRYSIVQKQPNIGPIPGPVIFPIPNFNFDLPINWKSMIFLSKFYGFIDSSKINTLHMEKPTHEVTLISNPAHGVIEFDYEKIHSICIFNTSGKMLANIKLNSNNNLIDTRQFSDGMYIFEISNPSNSVINRQKIIIMN